MTQPAAVEQLPDGNPKLNPELITIGLDIERLKWPAAATLHDRSAAMNRLNDGLDMHYQTLHATLLDTLVL